MTKSGNVSPRSPKSSTNGPASPKKVVTPLHFLKTGHKSNVRPRFFADDKWPAESPGIVSSSIAFFQERTKALRHSAQASSKPKSRKNPTAEKEGKRNWGYSPYVGNIAVVVTPDCSYMDGRNSPTRQRKSSVPITDLKKIFFYDGSSKNVPPKQRYEAMDTIPSESYDDTGYNAVYSRNGDDVYNSDQERSSDEEENVVALSERFQRMDRTRFRGPAVALMITTLPGIEEDGKSVTDSQVSSTPSSCNPRSQRSHMTRTDTAFPSAMSSPATPLAAAFSAYFDAPFNTPSRQTTPASSSKGSEYSCCSQASGESEKFTPQCSSYDLKRYPCAAPNKSEVSIASIYFSNDGCATRRRSVKEIVDTWGVR
jgi:hypothetical protein